MIRKEKWPSRVGRAFSMDNLNGWMCLSLRSISINEFEWKGRGGVGGMKAGEIREYRANIYCADWIVVRNTRDFNFVGMENYHSISLFCFMVGGGEEKEGGGTSSVMKWKKGVVSRGIGRSVWHFVRYLRDVHETPLKSRINVIWVKRNHKGMHGWMMKQKRKREREKLNEIFRYA